MGSPHSIFLHPFILKFHIEKLPEGQSASPQFAISVPKKKLNKAHDRNTIKRRVREAYRLNWKSFFPEESQYKILLLFIFIAKEKTEYLIIEKNMRSLFEKMEKQFMEM